MFGNKKEPFEALFFVYDLPLCARQVLG